MGAILDVLGALMIGTMLLLMMMSFQMQLRETADRTIYASYMMSHEQVACKELNGLIALAGVNIPIDELAVTEASPTRMAFQTYWDYQNNVMTTTANTISFTLNANATDVGRELNILQSASPVYNLGAILWLEDLQFYYYDIDNTYLGQTVTGNARLNIYSVDVGMTFKRDAPNSHTTPLRTKVQLRCYMMNRYLRYSN